MSKVKNFDPEVKSFVQQEVVGLLQETDGPSDAWEYAPEIAEDAIERFHLDVKPEDFEPLLRELIFGS